MQETQRAWVQSWGWQDLLEKGMETHSSLLSWRIPWTEEPGGLRPMGSQSQTWLKQLRHSRTQAALKRAWWWWERETGTCAAREGCRKSAVSFGILLGQDTTSRVEDTDALWVFSLHADACNSLFPACAHILFLSKLLCYPSCIIDLQKPFAASRLAKISVIHF